MKFKPTHIHKKTGEKVRVLRFFSFTKPKPHVEAMYERELIFAEPLKLTPPIVLGVVNVSALPVTLPVKFPKNVVALAVPLTSNSVEGVAVPIPNLPSAIILALSVLSVKNLI